MVTWEMLKDTGIHSTVIIENDAFKIICNGIRKVILYEEDEGFVRSEIYLVNTPERRPSDTKLFTLRGREQSSMPPPPL